MFVSGILEVIGLQTAYCPECVQPVSGVFALQVNAAAESPPENALLWALQLDGGGGAREVDVASMKPGSELPALHWVHLCYDLPESEAHLERLQIPANVIEALLAQDTRPRCLTLSNGSLVVLRGINTNPEADPEDMISLRLWCTPKGIVSARKSGRRLMSVQAVRDRLEQGEGPETVGGFMALLLDELAGKISATVETLNSELTDHESHLEADVVPDRVRLAELRRRCAAIRRYLAPQRDALDGLSRERSLLQDSELLDIRNIADRMTRYVEDLDLCRERAMVLQDELRNRLAEQQNERMYVLSLITAIFLPLSFMTGVFGMNVAGLPGTERPDAFVILAVSMGALAAGLLFWLRWRRWM